DRLSISRTYLYRLLDSGELSSVWLGRSRRIPTAALQDFVARLGEDSSAVNAAVTHRRTDRG
ncbi:MAG: Helix-turn-helix domain, partial [Frankiales bacterium]|nr:Helix-turn-helix domain [Frankiales bacterium]